MSESVVAITTNEVFVMHELLIEIFGGMRGITEAGFGKLDAALAAPDQSMFGEDLYVGLAAKAGALFYHVARAHAIADGNKRIALLALLDYLARHDARLRADDQALYEFTMAVAHDWSSERTTSWIEDRLESVAD